MLNHQTALSTRNFFMNKIGERKMKERNKHTPLVDKNSNSGLVEEGCAISERIMITMITIKPRLFLKYNLKVTYEPEMLFDD